MNRIASWKPTLGSIVSASLVTILAAPRAAAAGEGGAAAAPKSAAATLEAPVRLKAGEAFVDTGKAVAHAGPLLHDLDRDGKPDLLVGNFMGHFQLYRNVGTKEAPAFEDEGLLQADGKDASVHNW